MPDGVRPGLAAAVRRWRTPARRRGRRAQVQDVGLAGSPLVASALVSGRVSQASRAARVIRGLRSERSSHRRRGNRGSGRRAGRGDRDPGDRERPAAQRDPVADADAERVGEGPLEHHAAGAHPGALGHLGLVDRGRRRVAALPPRPAGGPPARAATVDADREGPTVPGDPGGVRQRSASVRIWPRAGRPGRRSSRGELGHDVRARGRGPGLLVRAGRSRRAGRARGSAWRWRRRSPAAAARTGPGGAGGRGRPAGNEQDRAHGVSPPARRARRGCPWCRRSAGSRPRTPRRASRSAGRRWPRSGRRGSR